MAREPRQLQLSGEVDAYGGGMCTTSPEVGGRNVVSEIEEMWGGVYPEGPHVRVLLGVEPIADGHLSALHGFGGTDVTPPESPVIEVGDIDLLDKLRDLDGRTVILIIEEVL